MGAMEQQAPAEFAELAESAISSILDKTQHRPGLSSFSDAAELLLDDGEWVYVESVKPVVPPQPLHIRPVVTLPGFSEDARTFFRRASFDQPPELAKFLEPFASLAEAHQHIAHNHVVEVVTEVTMAMLLSETPGGDICVCRDPYCRIGPSISL